MFWKKDFWTKETATIFKDTVCVEPMFRDTKLAELGDIEDVEQVQKELNSKLNLILKYLNLEYVPEKETKEEAKLVEKKGVGLPEGFGEFVFESASGNNRCSWNDRDFDEVDIKPKKKRKYTKRKK